MHVAWQLHIASDKIDCVCAGMPRDLKNFTLKTSSSESSRRHYMTRSKFWKIGKKHMGMKLNICVMQNLNEVKRFMNKVALQLKQLFCLSQV